MRSSAVILALLLSSCAPSRTPGAAAPGPLVIPPSRDSVVMTPVTPLTWSSGVFRISIEARTAQADSTATDSLRRHGTVRLIPDVQGLLTVLRFEAAGDSADSATTASASHVIRLTVDSTGKSALRELLTTACTARLPELSPLLVRQLVFPVDPRVFTQQTYVTDSLVYSSCIQGIQVQSLIELQWNRSPVQPSELELHLGVRFKGRVLADSSRRLPMRLTGSLSGTSSLVFLRRNLGLQEARSTAMFDLEAASGGTRRQRFTQTVTYHAFRDTSGSIH
jgi:hypothetical protein